MTPPLLSTSLPPRVTVLRKKAGKHEKPANALTRANYMQWSKLGGTWRLPQGFLTLFVWKNSSPPPFQPLESTEVPSMTSALRECQRTKKISTSPQGPFGLGFILLGAAGRGTGAVDKIYHIHLDHHRIFWEWTVCQCLHLQLWFSSVLFSGHFQQKTVDRELPKCCTTVFPPFSFLSFIEV